MLTLNNISKSYGSKDVLRNISATFDAGRVYGIVGENGAGKSTLMHCIAQIEPHLGAVDFSGGNIKSAIGILPTTPVFMSYLTAREYLRFCAIARHQEQVTIDQINIFDLPLDQYATTYSTGMKKKLALTGLLLQKNEIFLLDEPFNGVDLQSNLFINEIIMQLKQKNKIVLISSHIFSTLRHQCDEIFHLYAGTLKQYVGQGDYDELESKIRGNQTDSFSDRLGFL